MCVIHIKIPNEISKNLLFWREKIGNTFQPEKTTKLSIAKTLRIWHFFFIFGQFCHHNALRFYQTPHSSSREPTARGRSLWNKCWRRKDSRHSPCSSEVGSPSSPVKFAWEKLGRLLFVIAPAPAQNDARVPHDQCRQPYHSCCQ